MQRSSRSKSRITPTAPQPVLDALSDWLQTNSRRVPKRYCSGTSKQTHRNKVETLALTFIGELHLFDRLVDDLLPASLQLLLSKGDAAITNMSPGPERQPLNLSRRLAAKGTSILFLRFHTGHLSFHNCPNNRFRECVSMASERCSSHEPKRTEAVKIFSGASNFEVFAKCRPELEARADELRACGSCTYFSA